MDQTTRRYELQRARDSGFLPRTDLPPQNSALRRVRRGVPDDRDGQGPEVPHPAGNDGTPAAKGTAYSLSREVESMTCGGRLFLESNMKLYEYAASDALGLKALLDAG